MDDNKQACADNNEGNEYTVIAAPADIWLCYGVLSSSDDHDVILRTSKTEVSWSHIKEDASDVHYVLADRLNAADAKIARLRLLLAHAVEEADGWHDENNGGPIKGDALIDEARALVRLNVKFEAPGATPLAADPNNPRMLNFPMVGWVAVKVVRAIERAHGIG